MTDADLLLGYLNPGYFAGGSMRIDRDAASTAAEPLARALGLSVSTSPGAFMMWSTRTWRPLHASI